MCFVRSCVLGWWDFYTRLTETRVWRQSHERETWNIARIYDKFDSYWITILYTVISCIWHREWIKWARDLNESEVNAINNTFLLYSRCYRIRSREWGHKVDQDSLFVHYIPCIMRFRGWNVTRPSDEAAREKIITFTGMRDRERRVFTCNERGRIANADKKLESPVFISRERLRHRNNCTRYNSIPLETWGTFPTRCFVRCKKKKKKKKKSWGDFNLQTGE